MEKLFAACSPGTEEWVAQELRQLGLPPTGTSSSAVGSPGEKGLEDEVGGVEFHGALSDVYRANLHLRIASRVLVRLGEFPVSTFTQLRRQISRLPWERYLETGRPVALRVACSKSRLYHSGAVAEHVAGGMAARLGRTPSVQKFDEDAVLPPQLILIRLVENRCTISLDSSGARLHRRGYRQATAKAPLRETLAAAILLASQWEPTRPLLDPFCGSGTIAIEAAMLALKIPPGRARRFAFMEWPNFQAGVWEILRAEAAGQNNPLLPKIFASDRDAGAIRAAQANAERAGVADWIDFSCRAVSAIEPPIGPGWVVTNPPYGVRLKAPKDLPKLYAQLGKVLRTKCPGWRVAMLGNSTHLLHCTGLEFDRGIRLLNGGLKVKLVRSTIPQAGLI